jgi:hypothetical protein
LSLIVFVMIMRFWIVVFDVGIDGYQFQIAWKGV